MEMPTIAFIGAGNMASSLIGGLIKDDYDPAKIIASNPPEENLNLLKEKFGIITTTINSDAAKLAEVLVFSVKPNVVKEVAIEIADIIQQRQSLVISIAAGIPIKNIDQWLGGNLPIVRCMPNTPALVGSGATALYANSKVSSKQRQLAESIMRAVGLSLWLEHEEQLDTVTALSGSGPAYFFLMMDALEQGAVELGLPQETARLLTLQTALGAARMALESKDTTAELRRKVTSPGGTTASAVKVLEEGQLKQLFANALAAAKKRSQELAQLL